MARPSQVLYEGAPEMLMNRIHEVNSLLSQAKIKTGENESWKFWNKTSQIMMYAWGYMNNLEYVIKQNRALQEENHYMRAALAHEREINMNISVLMKLKLSGNFEEVVENVNKIMELGINDMGSIFRG